METRMAPSYANLFMGKLEQSAIENTPFKPYVRWRFIDDIFMVWTEKLSYIILNPIHPTVKFIHEYSESSSPRCTSPSQQHAKIAKPTADKHQTNNNHIAL